MAASGDPWQLGRRLDLDGLRGVAISLVVISHLSPEGDRLRYLGLAGVVMFFVLSGFLITSLLVDEHARAGRVDLVSFFRRRVRRLAPALVACVAVVALLGLALGASYAPPALVVGAVTWSSNWIIAGGGFSGTALSHTWSLAIEEQFYVVWPVVLLALVSRRPAWLVRVIAVGICVSAALRFVLIPVGVDRINNGSDTRADALLIGCLLAVLLHRATEGRPRPALSAVLLAVVVASGLVFPMAAAVLILPVTTALATAALIACSVHGEGVPWLRWSAVVRLGQRSYGLYLWHWPIIVLTHRLLDDAGWPVVALVALPVSAALTWLSWHLVEQPFLDRRTVTHAPAVDAVALRSGA